MDIMIHCITFSQLGRIFLSPTTPTNADTDSPSGVRTTWLHQSPIVSMLKTTGKCKFELKITSPDHQTLEFDTDELDALIDPKAAMDTLYLPRQLTAIVLRGIPECPTQLVINKNNSYKLESMLLENLPRIPADINVLQSLKHFECMKLYAALIDISILTNMAQMESISLHEIAGMTVSHSMHLPSLDKLTVDNSPMIVFNNVVCDFPKLTLLRLINNSLEGIPNTFSTCSQLTEVHIIRNKLRYVTFDVFSRMTQLERLYLNQNEISELTAENRVELPRLRVLYLDHNKLTMLDFTQILMPSLESLSLANNQLKQVPGLLTLISRKWDNFQLHDNPWDCSWLNQTVGNILDQAVDAANRDICGVKFEEELIGSEPN